MDEKKKLTEDELAQVSGGSSGGVVTTDCYYCSQKHPMRCETGVNIIPNGLKKNLMVRAGIIVVLYRNLST